MVRRSRFAKEQNMNGEVLSRRDVHRAITDTIVAAIEADAQKYRMPWHQRVAHPVGAHTA